MPASTWTDSDTAKAEQIWLEYQRGHDLSRDVGKTVGIDPRSGRVWIGESIPDVLAQRDADGIDSLLFFERVGSKTYFEKRAKRGSRAKFERAIGKVANVEPEEYDRLPGKRGKKR